jgi:kynurenine formamidase
LDGIGAVSQIKAARIRQSTKLIRRGKVFSLAQKYEQGMPTVSFHGPFLYTTYRTVDYCLKTFKEYENKLGSTVCRYELSDHTGTHIDSLNHATIGYKTYGDTDIRTISTIYGTSRFGIDEMPPVVGRGLLLDFPRYFGVEMLEDSKEITVTEIEEVLSKQGLSVEVGDVVLFYTGRCKLWMNDNQKYLQHNPGPGKEAAMWLVKRKVSLTGADNSSFEVEKPNSKELYPCHQILITNGGVRLMENLRLDELAKAKEYEFMFVVTPLKFKGGAGSPIAPIAVV